MLNVAIIMSTSSLTPMSSLAPLPFMPYALLAPRHQPGALLAGMQNGELWRTEDAGETWRRLDVTLPALLALGEATIAS